MEILRWAREQGCPWDDLVHSQAAIGGHLEVIEWAVDNGLPCNPAIAHGAAARGHYHVIAWALRRRLNIPTDVMELISQRSPKAYARLTATGTRDQPKRRATLGRLSHGVLT